MPILDIAQRDRELGRIRIGAKADGGKRPVKLEKFRFTSADRSLIEAIAKLYGGTAAPWNNDGKSEFEVYTTADRVPILLPPEPINQWYEMWSGGGCQRRCDGRINVLKDSPCVCPSDPIDRSQAAAFGKACKPTTRLNVVLADVEGVGVWRLESHGYHAASKLPKLAQFLSQAAQQGVYLPAVLGLEKRSVKRPGEGRKEWVEPFIHMEATPRALMSGGVSVAGPAAVTQPQRAALTAGNKTTNYKALLEQAKTVDAVRELWWQAKNAGDMNPELESLMAARSADLAPTPQLVGNAPAESEPAEAEIVGEDFSESDDVWFKCMEHAPDGWSDSQLNAEFARRNGGELPATASVEALRDFLEWLKDGAR
jgi:hypothetical protein